MKKCSGQLFGPWKLSKRPFKSAKMITCLNLNLKFQGHVLTFRAENTTEIGLLRQKIIPKHSLNNSKKTVWKSVENNFFDSQNGQNYPTKPPKWAVFLNENLIFEGIYQPFDLKIQP